MSLLSRPLATLSRKRARDYFFRPPRHLVFTRFGGYTVLLTLGIGFGGMNTGNNLVYMIFGMMLGFITASGILSEMSLRSLEIDWILPGEWTAKETGSARLILRNRKQRLPSFGLRVSGAEDMPFTAWVPFVPSSAQVHCDIVVTPLARGRKQLTQIKIETEFPFGFFRKYLLRPQTLEWVAYPQKLTIDPKNAGRAISEENPVLTEKGWGDSYRSIRDYVPGDNPRHMAWKPTARTGKLMLKELEKEVEKKWVYTLLPLDPWQSLSQEELESAMSFGASLLRLLHTQKVAVGLISSETFVAPSLSKKELGRMLKILALFDPRSAPALTEEPHAGALCNVPLLDHWRANSR